MTCDENYELDIASDLCITSFNAAMDKLEKIRLKNKVRFCWFHLFVASQMFGTAHDVSAESGLDNISVEVDFGYASNEWGLCLVGFSDEGKTTKVKVHSEGA